MNGMYQRLLNKEEKLCVIGMGYVGAPIAVGFSKHLDVIGFDINKEKIERLKKGQDVTGEVQDEVLKHCSVDFTSDENKLSDASFFIVAVPTPVNKNNTPDLKPLKSASTLLGKHIKKGSVVVYESTVYPGLTEEVCIPIIEKESGLKFGVDFKAGYSPERINPGDKVHRLDSIIKIVSGSDKEALDLIAKVYELVVEAGVYRAESIKVAEAAKVIENSQRDINIAFMNELSIIFHKLDIDTKAVLEAAGTKWNFLNFQPGLVGGHCIGVDPYYLTYKAEQLGYNPQVLLAGRRINDGMGRYIARCFVKKMIAADINMKGAKIGVFGITFKENCPDIRNTKVVGIIRELQEYGAEITVIDPLADTKETMEEYGIPVITMEEAPEHAFDAVMITTMHDVFKEKEAVFWKKYFKEGLKKNILGDIKGIYSREDYEKAEYDFWRL